MVPGNLAPASGPVLRCEDMLGMNAPQAVIFLRVCSSENMSKYCSHMVDSLSLHLFCFFRGLWVFLVLSDFDRPIELKIEGMRRDLDSSMVGAPSFIY